MRAYKDRFPFNELGIGDCVTYPDPRVWDAVERAAKTYERDRPNYFLVCDLQEEEGTGRLVFRVWRVTEEFKYGSRRTHKPSESVVAQSP